METQVLGSAKPYIRLARGLLSVVLPATQPILENLWDIDRETRFRARGH